MKQCPNCKRNLADFVPACPFCGAGVSAGTPGRPPTPQSGPREESGKATASLLCGVLFFLLPAAIAAIVLGHISLSEINKSAGRMAGRGRAIAGLALGYAGVAFLPFVLIIAAIAIPNLLRAKIAANEASALATLGTYNLALVTYLKACPDVGYPASLESLGPGSRDCSHMNLVPSTLAAQVPVRSGYRFFYMRGQTPEGNTDYVLAADPLNPGTTGMRHFFTDQSGVIRYSARGAADAKSQPLQ